MSREHPSHARSVVWINGSFGVGKTTVGRALRMRLHGSRLFDPERIGYVLRRLPKGLPLSTAALDDFRQSPTWVALTVRFVQLLSRIARPLIVPMALEADQLRAIRAHLSARGCRVIHLCLIASERSVRARLAARGVAETSDEGRWVYPRAIAACRVQRASEYAVHIDTEDVEPEHVVEKIVALLRDRWDEEPR